MPATETGHEALNDMLRSMERDRDVWIGFTWWSAGSRWGNYMFSIEPKDGQDRQQLIYLIPHFQTPRAAREDGAPGR